MRFACVGVAAALIVFAALTIAVETTGARIISLAITVSLAVFFGMLLADPGELDPPSVRKP